MAAEYGYKSNSLSEDSKELLDEYVEYGNGANWVDFFPKILGQQFTLMLCNSPWKITFKYGNGVSREAQARWEQITESSEWNQFTKRLVGKLSQDGHVATPVNIGANGVPFFSMAEQIVKWGKLIGEPLHSIQVIQRYDQSLVPKIWTTTYNKKEITNVIKTEEQSKDKNKNDRTSKTETVINKWGIVPVVWWENRTRFDNLNIGIKDTEYVKYSLERMDAIWNKIGDEIMYASTEIVSYTNEGGFMNEMLSPEQRKEKNLKIKKFLNNNLRHYQLDPDNNDNKQFYINQKEAKIDNLRKEFNELLNSVIFLTGAIQYKDRSGTVQITDSQQNVNRSSNLLVCEDKIHQLTKGIKELIKIITLIDPEREKYWTQYQSVDIDIFVSDPTLEREMRNTPEKFLMLGYTTEDLVRQIKKVPNDEAKKVVKQIQKDIAEDPLTNFLITKDIKMFQTLLKRSNENLAQDIERDQLLEKTTLTASVENEKTNEIVEEAIEPNFNILDESKNNKETNLGEIKNVK